MKLIYGIDAKPKFSATIVFALQQLLAIMAATLVVPVIIGNGMQPAAALFGAGVGTLVYVLFTLRKSPVFLGSSFAFLGSMAAAFAGGVSMQLGYLGLIVGAIFAGLVYVVIAAIVKFAGVNWINKLMPAVIIGSTVAIIGLSLAGNAIGDLQKVNYSFSESKDSYKVSVSYNEVIDSDGNTSYLTADGSAVVYVKKADGTLVYTEKDKEVTLNSTSEGYAEKLASLDNQAKILTTVDGNGNAISNVVATKDKDTAEHNGFVNTPGSVYVALICGLITLIVTTICATFGKKIVKLIPFIIGILSGYVAAVVFYLIGEATGTEALKIINFEPFKALVSDGFGLKTFFTLPTFTFTEAIKAFDDPALTATYIGSIAVAYIPVAFVVFAEHIADHKNISSIVEKDLLEDPGLSRTLLGDGVGSMVGAFFGGCPNTTYGESIGCVAISGNASVVTIICAAIMAILIAFIAPFVAFVNSIPSCVMGGVCVALYGFIAVSGLKMLQKVDLEDNKNLFVASVILIAGVGGLSIVFGKVTITTIACALILGIIVNVILSRKKADNE